MATDAASGSDGGGGGQDPDRPRLKLGCDNDAAGNSGPSKRRKLTKSPDGSAGDKSSQVRYPGIARLRMLGGFILDADREQVVQELQEQLQDVKSALEFAKFLVDELEKQEKNPPVNVPDAAAQVPLDDLVHDAAEQREPQQQQEQQPPRSDSNESGDSSSEAGNGEVSPLHQANVDGRTVLELH